VKNAEYRERVRAARRRYRESHKEEVRARHQRRWKADPAYREKIRATRRRYRESHNEELREQHRQRWQADPAYREKIRAARRRYRAAHKEELRERRRLKRLTDPEYRERQRAREREWRRKRYFREVYRISLEDYDVMLAQQNGACAICGRTPKERLAVDHCHATGNVRGLLCAKCNSGLAFYQDNPDRLLAAIAYLESSRGDATAQLDGADVTDAGPSPDGPSSSVPIKG
jgi:hypothetical protein